MRPTPSSHRSWKNSGAASLSPTFAEDMKRTNILIGMMLGATIWAISPILLHQKEAWDSLLPYLFLLFLSGVVSPSADPAKWWQGIIGIYLGQFLFIFIFLGPGNLWPISMFTGALLMFPAIIGGLLSFGWWTFRKRRTETTKKQGSDRDRDAPRGAPLPHH